MVLVVVAIVVAPDQLRSSGAMNPLDSTQQFGFTKKKNGHSMWPNHQAYKIPFRKDGQK